MSKILSPGSANEIFVFLTEFGSLPLIYGRSIKAAKLRFLIIKSFLLLWASTKRFERYRWGSEFGYSWYLGTWLIAVSPKKNLIKFPVNFVYKVGLFNLKPCRIYPSNISTPGVRRAKLLQKNSRLSLKPLRRQYGYSKTTWFYFMNWDNYNFSVDGRWKVPYAPNGWAACEKTGRRWHV